MDICGVLFRLDSRFQAAAGAKLPVLDGVRRNTFRSPGHQEGPHATRTAQKVPQTPGHEEGHRDNRKATTAIRTPGRTSRHQEGAQGTPTGCQGNSSPRGPPWDPPMGFLTYMNIRTNPWRRHLRFLHKAQEAGEDAVQKEANRHNDRVGQSALGTGAVEALETTRPAILNRYPLIAHRNTPAQPQLRIPFLQELVRN